MGESSTSILAGLGKPTRRGIKKCFKCGTYNGTKGSICKNPHCNTTFRDLTEKKRPSLDAVRLLVGNLRQVYSVRVRDQGPECRGFVQLPIAQLENAENVLSEMALCFVDCCQSLFHNSILQCHENQESNTDSLRFCDHIRTALKSKNVATPLLINYGFIEKLNIEEELKYKLLALSENGEMPIVQRVSKYVMAVKCQATPKHPLGYLHFHFKSTKGKDIYEKFICGCSDFRLLKSNYSRVKCIHYYACICALASHLRISEEFSNFIKLELPLGCTTLYAISILRNILSPSLPRYDAKKISYKNNLTLTKQSKTRHKESNLNIISITNSSQSQESAVASVPSEPVVWTFTEWLTYATESINMTMKFENIGIPNSLTFDIPFVFYDSFRKTIPEVYKACPLPEQGEIFYVMSISHVKQIFQASKIKLQVSKRFIHTEDQGYVEYEESVHDNGNYSSTFIYFLNVGQLTVDESDNINNPFLILWSPNLGFTGSIGRLKLQYKYGRKSI